jgi:amino acid permease
MVSLGEMVAFLPIPGGHIKLAERFVNPGMFHVSPRPVGVTLGYSHVLCDGMELLVRRVHVLSMRLMLAK